MTNLLPTLQIEIRSAPESVALIRATILKVALTCGLQPAVTDNLTTAVSEACNNVVLHAYPQAPGRLIFSMDVNESCVDAEVRDFGRGARTLVSSGDGLGLGVGLIQSTATRAQFESRPGSGMTVRMSFDRPVTEAPEAAGARAPASSSASASAMTPQASPQPAGRQAQRRPFGNAHRVSEGSLSGSV